MIIITIIISIVKIHNEEHVSGYSWDFTLLGHCSDSVMLCALQGMYCCMCGSTAN